MNHSKCFYHIMELLWITLFFVSCSGISSVPPVPTSTLVITPSIEVKTVEAPETPAYAEPGPYTVRKEDLIIAHNDYQLIAFAWYPIQDNGKPNVEGGPFPLVVFASGWATPPMEGYSYLLEHIASYGFVAVTWVPRSENSDNTLNLWYAPLAYRPLDYQLLVDHLESMTAQGGELEGMMDMNRIVIAGHSLGGGTALSESGAQIDFSWCSAHEDLIYKSQENTCRFYVDYQKEIADNLGLKTVPEGKWPPMSDPRIVAMVAMAPMGELWGADYESVAAIKVPALIMVGSMDDVLPPDYAAYPIYEHLSSQKSLVVFEYKDHILFWGPGYSSGTPEDLERIKHIATAFILAEAKGDKEAAKALSPANLSFPRVKFETTEFK